MEFTKEEFSKFVFTSPGFPDFFVGSHLIYKTYGIIPESVAAVEVIHLQCNNPGFHAEMYTKVVFSLFEKAGIPIDSDTYNAIAEFYANNIDSFIIENELKAD